MYCLREAYGNGGSHTVLEILREFRFSMHTLLFGAVLAQPALSFGFWLFCGGTEILYTWPMNLS